MRKTLLSVLGLLCFMIMQAQIAKTVNMTQAGTLDGLLTANEKNTITDLILTGPIDARDFKTMRDLMPVLTVLDMEGANIEEYSGNNGTDKYTSSYPANEIPTAAFSSNYNFKLDFTTVKIPAGVTSIGNYAFSGCRGLRDELKFPTGVTSIGDFAFYHCDGLTGALKLPAELTSIGDHAFYNCYSLTGILNLPAGITSIGSSAFSGCSGFVGELNLPAGITLIRDGAFSGCKSLTGELALPAGITSIGSSAFSGCNQLTGVKFPAGLTSIEDHAFLYCDGLTGELALPAGLMSIGSFAFLGCSGLTGTLKIPVSVISIGSSAFLRCSGLTSIHIDKNVKNIESEAFLGCSNVSKITCETVAPPSLEADVFQGIDTKTCELHVPQGSAAEYQSAPQWNLFSNIIEMDNPTGIITPDKSIRTWRANGQLFVESTEELSAAEVVDMSGRTVCSVSKTAYAYVLNIQKKGVYVVRIRTVNGEVKPVKVAM